MSSILKTSDIDFLLNEVEITENLRDLLRNYSTDNDLTEDEIVELDDCVADQLCIDGFKDDKPTLKGLYLEDIRDKLTKMLNAHESNE